MYLIVDHPKLNQLKDYCKLHKKIRYNEANIREKLDEVLGKLWISTEYSREATTLIKDIAGVVLDYKIIDDEIVLEMEELNTLAYEIIENIIFEKKPYKVELEMLGTVDDYEADVNQIFNVVVKEE